MKIPGVFPVALLAAAYAFLQSLASGVSMLEFWWVPVAVALLGVLLKWLDVLRPVSIDMGMRTIENDSKLRRFWLG